MIEKLSTAPFEPRATLGSNTELCLAALEVQLGSEPALAHACASERDTGGLEME
jgi:hypothetical protein